MPRPIRVIHVNDIASVGATLVAGLRSAGLEADLLDPPRPGARISMPWRSILAPVRLGALVAVVPRVWFGRFDIVHAHFAWKAAIGLVTGRPLVVHCHGSDVRDVARRSLLGALNASVLRRAVAVYYATPDLARWVLPLRPDARFLPNPIDTVAFRPSTSVPDRDVLVGVRLDPVKGPDEIGRLLARLIEVRPATTVTVLDQGSRVADALRRAGAHVELIPPVRHDAMPALLLRHRVAIGQFGVGALGNYELEAMAAGLPVAALYRFPDAYDEPPPLVRGADPGAAGEAVAGLLDDDEARRSLASAGREWVVAHHERDSVVAHLVVAYRDLLGRG